MAFQTRWDVSEEVMERRGVAEDICMPVQQPLDLIIYNLNNGYQYQLMPTDYREALTALTDCIFFLNWAMKNGYFEYASEHGCKKTHLAALPDYLVEVGSSSISASECYTRAGQAFEHFKQTVRWEVFPAVE